MPAPFDADVAIVGAGPTGLMLALCLARQGVSAVLVDGKTEPTRESRAIILQARTMELLDQLGIAGQFTALATVATTLRPGFEGEEVAALNLRGLAAGTTPYPQLLVLEQSQTERLLVEALASAGTEVQWGQRFESFETSPDGVTLTLSGPTGETRLLRARYCVGADGSSSDVRKALGIPFDGTTNPQSFYVIDATGVTGLVPDSINIRAGLSGFLLTFPMGSGDHARLLGTVRGESEAASSEPVVRGQLEQTFSVRYEKSAWYSTYRVHHRVARRFREGRVFLAGDAAHVHSPVGAQGMNTGLQDAHNLACKLADVIRAGAADGVLDRYEAERRPVAQRLIATTDTLFGFVTSQKRAAQLARRAIVRTLAPVVADLAPRTRRSSRAFEYLGQVRIHYWMSDAAKAAAHGHRDDVVGRRLPWNGDNYDCLREFRWQVHAYGASAWPDLSPTRIPTSGLPVFSFPTIRNDLLEAGLLYLVRPDGFVAAAATPDDALEAFLAAGPVIR